jgi:hypothetical protein
MAEMPGHLLHLAIGHGARIQSDGRRIAAPGPSAKTSTT